MTVKRLLLMSVIMMFFSVCAEKHHELHTEPFNFTTTAIVQQESHVDGFDFIHIQTVFSEEKKELPYKKTETAKIQGQDRVSEFNNLKWFNIGVGQFEYVSQLRELMNLAREYDSKGQFEKEKEVSDMFCKILHNIDSESEQNIEIQDNNKK